MRTVVVFADGDLHIMALQDILADADVIGEIVGDANTDDPLIALKNPSPCVSYHDFVWSSPFIDASPIRLSKIREVY